jgi:hypothetical protein
VRKQELGIEPRIGTAQPPRRRSEQIAHVHAGGAVAAGTSTTGFFRSARQ